MKYIVLALIIAGLCISTDLDSDIVVDMVMRGIAGAEQPLASPQIKKLV